MIKYLPVVLLCLLFACKQKDLANQKASVPAVKDSSQQIVTTSAGKKIKLNADGTWEDIDKKNVATEVSSKTYTCSGLVEITSDRVTGKQLVMTKEPTLISQDEKTGFLASLLLSEKKQAVIFTIKVVSPEVRCIDEGDEMDVLFRDGSRMVLKCDSKFNCDGTFSTYFGTIFGKKDKLKELETKEVETIRVWGRGHSETRDLTEDNSRQLMMSFQCMAAEMR